MMKEHIGGFLISTSVVFAIAILTSNLAHILKGDVQDPSGDVIYYIGASAIVTAMFYLDEKVIKPFRKKL